eukprot:scaffold60292_cov32-Phaeocystis_antarctica.AAC.1
MPPPRAVPLSPPLRPWPAHLVGVRVKGWGWVWVWAWVWAWVWVWVWVGVWVGVRVGVGVRLGGPPTRATVRSLHRASSRGSRRRPPDRGDEQVTRASAACCEFSRW